MNKGRVSFIIFTCLVVIIWVVFDILHVNSNIEIDPQLQTVIEPFDPNFDEQALEIVTQEVVNVDLPNPLPTSVPLPTSIPLPSPSALPTPVATNLATPPPTGGPTP